MRRNLIPTLNTTIMSNEKNEQDWTKVLFEVILKILTLGFYHIEKHKK